MFTDDKVEADKVWKQIENTVAEIDRTEKVLLELHVRENNLRWQWSKLMYPKD